LAQALHRNTRRGDPSGEGATLRSAAGWWGIPTLLYRMGWALVVVAALGGPVLFCSCQSEGGREVSSTSEAVPLQVVEQMTLRESRAGKLRWCLVADSALTFAGEDRTLLCGVHVDFYNDSGDSIRSCLTALEGEVDEKIGDLFARGTVVIITRDGHKLETEELRWDNDLEKVVSDCFVRLTKGESVVTGVGIESDAELRSYTIRSQVEGSLQEEDRILDEF